MSKLTEQYKNEFILFLEAGFIAVNHADETSALKLFEASHLLKPESVLNVVGLGYLHMCKLELTKAEAHFKKVLDIDPSNEMAKTMLGITMSMSPSKGAQGEQILEELTHSSTSEVKKLSKDALDFVEQFVKKRK
ncbi:MAG: hypothetical protein K9M07_01730 [Simkaniaceae bacterium]|nr:hypothetical protein [Simkaniaceae bacterium]